MGRIKYTIFANILTVNFDKLFIMRDELIPNSPKIKNRPLMINQISDLFLCY
jgi:hypothetical protein